MTHCEMVDYICKWYEKNFRWQRFVYGQEIDRSKVDKMSDEELKTFIEQNCK